MATASASASASTTGMHIWGKFTQLLTGTPQNKISTTSYGRPATLRTGKINNRTPTIINEDNILQYLKIESMYLEKVIELIDDGKTVYVGETIPSGTPSTPITPNQIKKIKKDRLINAESNQMYEVYIVISLDIESMQQKVIYKKGEQLSKSNRICWKWGSEKKFFDILNVLVDQLTGQTLESYSKDNSGIPKPIDALKKLWRQFRDDTTTQTNNGTTQLRILKEKVKQISTSSALGASGASVTGRINLQNKFAPNTNTKYLNSDYILAFILKAYDPSIDKKYRKTFHLYQGLNNTEATKLNPQRKKMKAYPVNVDFIKLSYDTIKKNFIEFLKENQEYLEGKDIPIVFSTNFPLKYFTENKITKKNKDVDDVYYRMIQKVPKLNKLTRKERLIVETAIKLDPNQVIKYKLGGENLYIYFDHTKSTNGEKMNIINNFINYVIARRKNKNKEIPPEIKTQPASSTIVLEI